jgi:hypothetical protein
VRECICAVGEGAECRMSGWRPRALVSECWHVLRGFTCLEHRGRYGDWEVVGRCVGSNFRAAPSKEQHSSPLCFFTP